jgi:hypothetical protein
MLFPLFFPRHRRRASPESTVKITPPALTPARGHIANLLISSRVLSAKFQSIPFFQISEVQKCLENRRKIRKMPNKFCLNPYIKFYNFGIMIMP